jgi:hypothetical protein
VKRPRERELRPIKDKQLSSKDDAIKPKSINSFEQGSKLERRNSRLAITATPIHGGHFHAAVLPRIDTQMVTHPLFLNSR